VATGVVVREPVGVVGAITAYNYPLVLNLAKIVPALLMGNTIVLKPSPFTPLVTLLLADVAHSVGVPPGVLNIVTGGAEVGHGLTSDDRVDLVAFTGSEAVGSAVMTQSAPTIKKVLLELGGKSALVVCDDANVDEAVASAVYNFTAQAGQGCGALSRLLVHASVKEQFVETAKAMLESLTVGDPSDPAVTMGPLIRASQRAKVEGMVGDALADGATVITGGRRPGHLPRGYFYEPTLLTDVDNRDPIAQEEIFGPVSIVIGFDTDDEAIALANDSRYGLSGGVFSGDAGRAFDLARRIRTGSVRVNGGSGIEAPFGGYKRSGIGRERWCSGHRRAWAPSTLVGSPLRASTLSWWRETSGSSKTSPRRSARQAGWTVGSSRSTCRRRKPRLGWWRRRAGSRLGSSCSTPVLSITARRSLSCLSRTGWRSSAATTR
jgi:acyl-CoA reductase-like NAD-dependent aldehyde dehydrogenase